MPPEPVLPTQGLLDTSVLIARETGRPIDATALPDIAFVSVVTAAELEAGVHAATDPGVRSARMRTWAALLDIDLLEVDLGAAHEWALLRQRLASAGRRVEGNDLWIAAIALANGLAVVTQDDDFDVIRDVGGPEVIRI